MSDQFDQFSLKVRNYKCFSEKEQGFDNIKPINIIIGRNNTGKSSFLQIIGNLSKNSVPLQITENDERTPELVISKNLSASEIQKVFQPHAQGGGVPGGSDHWSYGSRWDAARITWSEVLSKHRERRFVDLDPPLDGMQPSHVESYSQHLAEAAENPLETLFYKHIQAERDIQLEAENDPTEIEPTGNNFTAIVRQFLNYSHMPSDLVEKYFLSELNKIMGPDAYFKRIYAQKYKEQSLWEIFLEEENKGGIPLSYSGSGLKTILLVLASTIISPYLESKKLANYVFSFEELENSLHPSLVRRLFSYIRNISVEHGCPFFITTHSNVVIDLFGADDVAQILHVTHDGKTSKARTATTYIENKGIIQDLDIRASDILQSNCVVWVEGPSDRLYFNRWIELTSDGKLREGAHYQCVFYGGRLLAHLYAGDLDNESDSLISILRVNGNAILLIDSDRKSKNAKINKTKQRVANEIKKIGGVSWVTAGREIENYIPVRALKSYFDKDKLPAFQRFQRFPEYLNKIKKSEGTSFSRSKVLFAEKIVPHIDAVGLGETLDLENMLTSVVRKIKF